MRPRYVIIICPPEMRPRVPSSLSSLSSSSCSSGSVAMSTRGLGDDVRAALSRTSLLEVSRDQHSRQAMPRFPVAEMPHNAPPVYALDALLRFLLSLDFLISSSSLFLSRNCDFTSSLFPLYFEPILLSYIALYRELWLLLCWIQSCIEISRFVNFFFEK